MVYLHNCFKFLLAAVSLMRIVKNVAAVMAAKAPGGLGWSTPTAELAMSVGISPVAMAFNWPAQGLDVQAWIMPRSTDTSSDLGLHQIATEGVATSLAVLEQGTGGETVSERVAHVWANLGAFTITPPQSIRTLFLMFPHQNMVSWMAFVVTAGMASTGVNCFVPAHIVKTEAPGQDPIVLTPKLDPVDSLPVDAFELKRMATDFGCKYSLQLLSEYNLAELPLQASTPIQHPTRCITLPTGSIVDAVERDLNVNLREPIISTLALIHAGLWDAAQKRWDYDDVVAKWSTDTTQKISLASALALLPPAELSQQLASLTIAGTKRNSPDETAGPSSSPPKRPYTPADT